MPVIHKHKIVRKNAGDTIVEVMIVLGVLSLAFAVSSATARRALSQSRNAEEHSQALGNVSSQVELLRDAVTQQHDTTTIFSGRPFCMNGSTPVPFSSSTYTVAPNAANDSFTSYPSNCKSNLYNQSIVYVVPDASDHSKDYFEFRSRWDGPGGLARQQELFTYRIPDLAANANSGITVSSTAAIIEVAVKSIPPGPGNTTPPCSDAATNNRSGATVVLHQTNGASTDQTRTTNASSIASFGGLTDYGVYQATITATPNRYEICPPSQTSATLIQPGSTNQLSLKMRPLCGLLYSSPYAHYSAVYAHYSAVYAHYSGYYDHYSSPYDHYYYGVVGYDDKGNPIYGNVYAGTYSDYLGYYQDYLGTYGDYLGTYADYLGTYADPPIADCP